MKLLKTVSLLSFVLYSVGCSGVDQRSEESAQAICEAMVSCEAEGDVSEFPTSSEATGNTNDTASDPAEEQAECEADLIAQHQEIEAQYGKKCLKRYLDLEDCFAANFSCDDGGGDDGFESVFACLDSSLSVFQECGVDLSFEAGDELY